MEKEIFPSISTFVDSLREQGHRGTGGEKLNDYSLLSVCLSTCSFQRHAQLIFIAPSNPFYDLRVRSFTKEAVRHSFLARKLFNVTSIVPISAFAKARRGGGTITANRSNTWPVNFY